MEDGVVVVIVTVRPRFGGIIFKIGRRPLLESPRLGCDRRRGGLSPHRAEALDVRWHFIRHGPAGVRQNPATLAALRPHLDPLDPLEQLAFGGQTLSREQFGQDFRRQCRLRAEIRLLNDHKPHRIASLHYALPCNLYLRHASPPPSSSRSGAPAPPNRWRGLKRCSRSMKRASLPIRMRGSFFSMPRMMRRAAAAASSWPARRNVDRLRRGAHCR